MPTPIEGALAIRAALSRFEGGRIAFLTAGFDLLIYVPPHRAPAVVREAGLCGESGWVPVDRATLATKFPDVWAIGSGNFYAEPLPDVRLRLPDSLWHLGKILYEKYWLYRRF